MKIIHCADLHLDSQMTANLTKKSRQESAKEKSSVRLHGWSNMQKRQGASDHDIGRSV